MRTRIPWNLVVVLSAHFAVIPLPAQEPLTDVRIHWYSTQMGEYLPENDSVRLSLTEQGTGQVFQFRGAQSKIAVPTGTYLVVASYPGFSVLRTITAVTDPIRSEMVFRIKVAMDHALGWCLGPSGVLPKEIGNDVIRNSVLIADARANATSYSLRPTAKGEYDFGELPCGEYHLSLQNRDRIVWNSKPLSLLRHLGPKP